MGMANAEIAGSEARRIVEEASQRGLVLRAIGGVAIWLHCAAEEIPAELKRDYVDLDFVCLSKQIPALTKMLIEIGYEPHRRFNAVLGSERLIFGSDGPIEHVDILVDQIRMCHTWDLRKRILIDSPTLPVADLLLSKLQIVKMTEKDLKDIYLLLLFHGLGANDNEGVNTKYIEQLLRNNWGFWKTVSGNLDKGIEYLRGLDFNEKEQVFERINGLRQLLITMEKGIKWRARGLIGEKLVWYELPGEVDQDPH